MSLMYSSQGPTGPPGSSGPPGSIGDPGERVSVYFCTGYFSSSKSY